ncbi:ATP-binding cassette domain-containing protein, partial [Acidomonas methanolica]
MTDATPTLLTVEDLHVAYPAGPFWARRARPVVRGVSFDVREGEIVGLIGESGSGKSTIARAVAGLAPVTAGRIALTGRVQMIFQDPLSSLDPMMRVGAQIEEVLAIHRLAPRGGRRARAVELLERVGLSADLHGRLPAALSGGQRARVG